ncbi:MAG TPA: SRPBCC domain-containing protein [Devosiaceae bacterium]|jgi:uncharacterized protein YndB with AHSA1/START domain|nr:SRPBCC domain-containing protein [Devosiaceae bacterium]
MRGNVISFRRYLERRRARRRADLAGRARTGSYRRLWTLSLDRLAEYLIAHKGDDAMDDLKIEAPVGQPFMTMTRIFNAPRALVWKALSQPEHAARWWGPHDHKNRVLQWDWRVGGKWRIESTLPDGMVIVFFGEYREIKEPVKVTQTFSFDQLPEGTHSVDMVELDEVDGKTIYRATSTLPDVESRDAMIASGMETGVREGFERLQAMLEDWKATAE